MIPGALRFARQGGARAASVIRCCAVPNDKPKKKASIPTSQVNNFYITGEVHIHIHGNGQAAEWDAVAMSPEAKALLQRHAVKASTALKMHNVLGFEDVGDLQHLSADLIAQLELKPLQLEPLLQLLREQQQQQQQGQQQQQQQQQQQPEDFGQAQDQQQHTGQTQAAGHTDASPSHEALPTADPASLPAASQASDAFPASADQHEDTWEAVPASAAWEVEGGVPPAAPAARARAHAEPGTDGQTQAGGRLSKHACVAIMQAGPVNQVAITPDGRRAVTAGPGSKLQVWDLEARSCIATLKGHTAVVLAVAITPDGRRAVSGSADKSLRVWDLDAYACTASMDCIGEDGLVESVAITPDGRHVLYEDGDELFRWAMDDTEARAFDSWGSADSIAVSPDGRLAVTGGYEGTLRVWDLEEEKLINAWEGHTSWVTSVAITPDGRHAVSASYSETDAMRVWDLATRTCIGTMDGYGSGVTCVAITPDGRRAVSGSKLRVWDLGRRTCTGIMEGHGSEVRCVAITPDGRFAVSGSKDGLRMWDLGPSSAHGKVPGSSPP